MIAQLLSCCPVCSAIAVWMLVGLSPLEHYLFHCSAGFIKCLHYYWWMADWLLRASDQIRKEKERLCECVLECVYCISVGHVWEKQCVWVSVRDRERVKFNVLGLCCCRKSNESVGTSRKLHWDVFVCVCIHACTRMMHCVCHSVSLLVPLGLLMNRHALPIKVKVMTVISTRHKHHSVLWWEATSVHRCCQLHYLPVEPYLSSPVLNTFGTLPWTWLIGHDCCLIIIRCCLITI